MAVGEQIENDQERGMRGREFLHAAGRGMKAKLKFIEGKCAVDRDGQLAVDHETFRSEALKKAPGFTGDAPGGPSRWSTERSAEWEPVDPKIVVEVTYDHFTGGRFRHGTKIVRYRPDKAPKQCTMDQVEHREGKSLALL